MKAANYSIGQLLRMGAGLLVWSSAFVLLYAGFSLGCQQLQVPVEAGLANPVTLGLLAIAGLHLIILVGLLLLRHRRPTLAAPNEPERSRHFRHWVEGLVLWVALAALIFIAFPVLMVPPCTG